MELVDSFAYALGAGGGVLLGFKGRPDDPPAGLPFLDLPVFDWSDSRRFNGGFGSFIQGGQKPGELLPVSWTGG